MPADRSKLPEVGADPVFSFPTIVHRTLPNGLKVRAVEHHSVPIVTLVLQVAGGSSADRPGREGLAALVADMVDEGTGSLSAVDVSDAIARIGGEYDLDVSPDTTSIGLTTLTRFADRGASLLADIATRPSLRDSDFARVRQLRLDRLTQIKDVPPAVAERAFLRLMYGDHPYGHLSIGSEASLQALTASDVAAMHASHYVASRATVVVAGALPADELIAIVERAFGHWQTRGAATPDEGDVPASATASWTPPQAPRLVVVARDGAPQSELRVGHLSAYRSTPDYAALLVMNAVLGGQFVSRVNLKLREEKGYTYGARTGFDWRLGLAPFTLQASVHTASTADAVRDSLNELTEIRDRRPVTDTELALAKASLTRGYPRNFETAQQVARSVAQLGVYGLPDSYFAEFIPKVNAVTPDEVTRVARHYLDPDRLTTLIVGDYAVIGASLAELGLGDPVLFPATV